MNSKSENKIKKKYLKKKSDLNIKIIDNDTNKHKEISKNNKKR